MAPAAADGVAIEVVDKAWDELCELVDDVKTNKEYGRSLFEGFLNDLDARKASSATKVIHTLHKAMAKNKKKKAQKAKKKGAPTSKELQERFMTDLKKNLYETHTNPGMQVYQLAVPWDVDLKKIVKGGADMVVQLYKDLEQQRFAGERLVCDGCEVHLPEPFALQVMCCVCSPMSWRDACTWRSRSRTKEIGENGSSRPCIQQSLTGPSNAAST